MWSLANSASTAKNCGIKLFAGPLPAEPVGITVPFNHCSFKRSGMNVAAAGRVGDVELLISGPAGRAAAQELADWWLVEAGVTLSVQDRVDTAAPGERSDGWAITATVIAIPAAILAALRKNLPAHQALPHPARRQHRELIRALMSPPALLPSASRPRYRRSHPYRSISAAARCERGHCAFQCRLRRPDRSRSAGSIAPRAHDRRHQGL